MSIRPVSEIFDERLHKAISDIPLQRIGQLCQAERMIGKTVYWQSHFSDAICQGEVMSVCFDEKVIVLKIMSASGMAIRKDIGTVFLAREEAEAMKEGEK